MPCPCFRSRPKVSANADYLSGTLQIRWWLAGFAVARAKPTFGSVDQRRNAVARPCGSAVVARLLWLGCCGSAACVAMLWLYYVVGAPLASRCSGFAVLWERRLRRDALALLCCGSADQRGDCRSCRKIATQATLPQKRRSHKSDAPTKATLPQKRSLHTPALPQAPSRTGSHRRWPTKRGQGGRFAAFDPLSAVPT